MVSILVRLLVRYDRWCVERLTALLLWLEEWASVTQKQFERMLILVFCLGVVLCEREALVGAFVALINGSMMWLIHLRPEAARRNFRRGDVAYMVFRVGVLQLLVGINLGVVCPLLYLRQKGVAAAFAWVSYVVFMYSSDISTRGERGRRRKLAMAELAKMFGTEWIPKPVKVYG